MIELIPTQIVICCSSYSGLKGLKYLWNYKCLVFDFRFHTAARVARGAIREMP